ncbi:phospholipase D-like domain-containing protein, partial [Bacteriovoracaceae bacterium]|nr:phospholipase D-like domain-containing protein [Bacteriovoracaceae bacterium]
MKLTLIFTLLLVLASCSTDSTRSIASLSGGYVKAMMSPRQGVKAFDKMYELIKEAKTDVNITIYSWSDTGLTKALHETLDREDAPIVRIVMKKDVFVKQAKVVAELEAKGAMFKRAKIELHEKFVLVDGVRLLNSSANMSGGAKHKYSENFVFFDAEGASKNSDIVSLLRDFKQEFAVIWNSGHDYITPDEIKVADVLNHKTKRANKYTALKNLSLLSSSMNYQIKAPSQRDFDKGSVIGLKRLPNKKDQIWMVKDSLVKAIKMAKKNVFVNINHFNIREISDELINAIERGIDVKLMVDSQEFKTYLNNREMTPQFVKDFQLLKGKKESIPVRVKFYSFQPHYKNWSLNHHKYMLVDYNTDNTFLLSGSYNFSKTAEHAKFDNQIVFKGKSHQHIYDAFAEEFEYLWSLERSEDDKVSKNNWNYLMTPVKGRL